MTLQERLRFELSRIADEECYDGGSHQLIFLRQSEARELRGALDAKDERIRELEGALRDVLAAMGYHVEQTRPIQRTQDALQRAREAIK